MIHHKKVCQYTFEKKMYYLVHSKSNIRGNVCQTYLMYVSIPMFFPDDFCKESIVQSTPP